MSCGHKLLDSSWTGILSGTRVHTGCNTHLPSVISSIFTLKLSVPQFITGRMRIVITVDTS